MSEENQTDDGNEDVPIEDDPIDQDLVNQITRNLASADFTGLTSPTSMDEDCYGNPMWNITGLEDKELSVTLEDGKLKATFYVNGSTLNHNYEVDEIPAMVDDWNNFIARYEEEKVIIPKETEQKKNQKETKMNNNAIDNVFNHINQTITALCAPVNSALVRMDTHGALCVAVNDRVVRFSPEAGDVIDVTGRTFSVLAGALFAVPGNHLEKGDLFIYRDKVCQVISDDGKTVRAFSFEDSLIIELVPEVISIGGKTLRKLSKLVYVYGNMNVDPTMMALVGGNVDEVVQTKMYDALSGDSDADLGKLLMLASMNGNNADMNGMLPLLMMGKGDIDPLMLMAMNGNNGGMNNMLPLMLMGKDSEIDPLMLMAMSGQNMNPLMMLAFGDLFKKKPVKKEVKPASKKSEKKKAAKKDANPEA